MVWVRRFGSGVAIFLVLWRRLKGLIEGEGDARGCCWGRWVVWVAFFVCDEPFVVDEFGGTTVVGVVVVVFVDDGMDHHCLFVNC